VCLGVELLQPPIPCGNHRHRAGAFLVFFSPPKTSVAAVSAVRRLRISLRETTAPREVPVHVAFSSLHYLYCHVLTHSAVRRVHALKSSNRHNATLTASKSVLSYVNNKFSRTTSTSDNVPCCLVQKKCNSRFSQISLNNKYTTKNKSHNKFNNNNLIA
jgi:hypothetical protein